MRMSNAERVKCYDADPNANPNADSLTLTLTQSKHVAGVFNYAFLFLEFQIFQFLSSEYSPDISLLDVPSWL